MVVLCRGVEVPQDTATGSGKKLEIRQPNTSSEEGLRSLQQEVKGNTVGAWLETAG